MPIQRGRASTNNRKSARFSLPETELDGDWLDAHDTIDGPAPKLRTEVTEEFPRSIISFNASPDIGFDRSINAYRGCEHGCIYCFARPSHAWHDLSPGLDFETKLFAKPDAARLLQTAFTNKRYSPRPIAMGTNTDPYQPIEASYRITRQILETCLVARHPVTITTKSDRVLRDLDLLSELATHKLTAVAISVTSLDSRLSRLLEPRAASPGKRLAALNKLAEAGIPAHCSVAPVIPCITDQYLEAIITKAAETGAASAGWIALRLPHEVAPLFREWLQTHFPDRAGKVMSIIRSMRQGRDNDPDFGTRMRPNGVWADLFRTRFRLACKRAGLGKPQFGLDCSLFQPAALEGQMSLF
ncbi:PA0069 family radical SAM protein [Altericroceibacterium spongiae]|uniref:PA0069 family radical SAM protein n=1 Tax=Altericroceibacterium spongiae TaxID=2320269 RepID=A0A420ES61_9SPHN|nr:PA0069 family radical SAM protein [Altericroceibacterium spongiae]RKF23566.1 PA0069 family radical SAM protein [Altericroceibacterium spongiae]